jgi:hypothetical protein
MVEEMESLDMNETWYLVELSDGMKPIGRKWVFKKNIERSRLSQEVQISTGGERAFPSRGSQLW